MRNKGKIVRGTVTWEPLPDGSTAHTETTGVNTTMITRKVDGTVVWGQVFSCGGNGEDHTRQVLDVTAEMHRRPADFHRNMR